MNKPKDNFALKHQIFILDAYLTKNLDCSQHKTITEHFISEFLAALGLVPLGPLGIYPAVDDRAPGWSFIQPITTSHISAHYFEKPGKGPHIRIDAYSCDAIDWNQLVTICDQHFKLSQWRGTFLDREINNERQRRTVELRGIGRTVTQQLTMMPEANLNNHQSPVAREIYF